MYKRMNHWFEEAAYPIFGYCVDPKSSGYVDLWPFRFQQKLIFLTPTKSKLCAIAKDMQSTFLVRLSHIFVTQKESGRGEDQGAIPLKHIGLYGYKASFLERFCQESPGQSLKKLKKLEQLRALEWGAKISLSTVHSSTIGIDSPEDLFKFQALIKAGTF